MPDMTSLEFRAINTVRTLSIDAIQKANSGHPGLPLGAAPMAYVLWQRHLEHHPGVPSWPDRDRFVLSAGHGSMLLYSLLHLTGYDLSMEDLQAFRSFGSRTPGHPEAHLTPGVEATTGPLGQGLANAVGMAIAERHLAARFNRDDHTIVDHFTYALAGDGCLMEGVAAEAVSLAGHLGLGKLIVLYDSNRISLDGPTSLSFTEDVSKRFESYGWQVLRVADGNFDLDAIDGALGAARAGSAKPTLIVVETTIGFGSPAKAGTSEAHGSPLGPDEVAKTKTALGWDPTQFFFVPGDVRDHFRTALERGARAESDWRARFEAYRAAFPDLAVAFEDAVAGRLPAGYEDALPVFKAGEDQATRQASGKTLNALAARVPTLFGGDADLSCSTLTAMKGLGTFDGRDGADAARGAAGRNVHFGVREHAMGSIANGIAYHGGMRPFTATFFCFADYMRPAIRLAAMNHLPVIFVFTHDSIGLGEDGPTHQPVEHLASLRAIPGLVTIRPADPNETVLAWRTALERTNGPTALVLTRQKLPVLDVSARPAGADLRRGGYVQGDAPGGPPQGILIATGSEVKIAVAAQKTLAEAGVRTRVVSLPSFELFEAQDAAYRESVLPRAITARVSIEAAVTFGWSRYVGDAGVSIGVDHYGASAPADVIYEKFGLTAAKVVDAMKSAIPESMLRR